jgi:hypothetical protein
MSFNLGGYGLADRDGSGQLDDPKPAGARAAVIALIAANRPDILAVQEIGNPLIFGEFRHALQQAGLDYEQAAYLQREHSENNLAVLSRFPITNILMHTHDRYRIGATNLPVTCGFLEVEIASPRNIQCGCSMPI